MPTRILEHQKLDTGGKSRGCSVFSIFRNKPVLEVFKRQFLRQKLSDFRL